MVTATVEKLIDADKTHLTSHATQIILSTKSINNVLEVEKGIILTKVSLFKKRVNRKSGFSQELDQLLFNLKNETIESVVVVEITTKLNFNTLVYLDSNLDCILGILQKEYPSVEVFSESDLLLLSELEELKNFEKTVFDTNLFWRKAYQDVFVSLKLWRTGFIEYFKTDESKTGTDFYKTAASGFVKSKSEVKDFLKSVDID